MSPPPLKSHLDHSPASEVILLLAGHPVRQLVVCTASVGSWRDGGEFEVRHVSGALAAIVACHVGSAAPTFRRLLVSSGAGLGEGRIVARQLSATVACTASAHTSRCQRLTQLTISTQAHTPWGTTAWCCARKGLQLIPFACTPMCPMLHGQRGHAGKHRCAHSLWLMSMWLPVPRCVTQGVTAGQRGGTLTWP